MRKKEKIPVVKISSVENTLRQMPKYNAFASGHGEHQDKIKHPNRAQRKASLEKELRTDDFYR